MTKRIQHSATSPSQYKGRHNYYLRKKTGDDTIGRPALYSTMQEALEAAGLIP